MPLPVQGGKFPPEHIEPVYDKLAVWSAWYSGEAERLSEVYTTRSGYSSGSSQRSFEPSSTGAGSSSALDRYFWGQQPSSGSERTKLHVPIASDIAVTSADMLFSEPPKMVCEDESTQAELDLLREEGDLDSALVEAAEVAAALCGVFLKVTWDMSVRQKPFICSVHPDSAIPEFRYGVLTAVTFWHVVSKDGDKVFRFLERHELGFIYYGLYLGNSSELGTKVPLDTFEQYNGMEEVVEAVPGKLTAVYVPNMRPSRCWRGNRDYAALGRSDYSGVEPLFDALDEAYTSWMRDLRLGKARVMVPNSYLESGGRGKGALFDADREYFTSLEVLGDQEMQIKEIQFEIRVDQHQKTCQNLLHQAVRSAGYSAQSFGESSDVAMTATEVVAKEAKTLVTREKKTRYWERSLSEILEVLLIVDASIFGASITPEVPRVEFSSVVKEQPLVLANTIKVLDEARAISTLEKVRTIHPDWNQDQVEAEVALISESEPSVPVE